MSKGGLKTKKLKPMLIFAQNIIMLPYEQPKISKLNTSQDLIQILFSYVCLPYGIINFKTLLQLFAVMNVYTI